MLNADMIRQKAKELGCSVCGIGSLDIFKGEDICRDPKMILPNAKCIIGFGFAVPKGLYTTMDIESQYYTYTTMGVKYIDEEMAEIFLLKILRCFLFLISEYFEFAEKSVFQIATLQEVFYFFL